ncbi:MAG: hypothetical protein COZ56_18595 [Armatimonadetes bacterium CG_4_8_14_3_um_filter_58_9]|nr:MAG: hypothetical protein COZ56_18595 [Armatimonadetes bacterium CG_4_8_14_3_um_filter_58_9]
MPANIHLPTVSSFLKLLCAVLQISGFVQIRQHRVANHRWCMTGAFIVYCLFLISCLTYHAVVVSTGSRGHGWIRPEYCTILITHTVLAAAIVPMVVVTLLRGLRLAVEKHRPLARLVLPLWR